MVRNSKATNAAHERDLSFYLVFFCLISRHVLLLFLYLRRSLQLIERNPVFSYEVTAKGVIEIGVFSQGIIAIGMISVEGQLGGELGIEIYQIDRSVFCFLFQISIALWETRKAQLVSRQYLSDQ